MVWTSHLCKLISTTLTLLFPVAIFVIKVGRLSRTGREIHKGKVYPLNVSAFIDVSVDGSYEV